MYKSILVPVDLAHTERAAPMFEYARALLAEGGKITVAHVVPAIPAYVSSEMPPGLEASASKQAQSELQKLVSEEGLDADVVIRSGSPHHVLLDLAESIGTDLVIVASHDPNISDYFLGSTAARVVRHAHCSVLVLR